MCSEKPGIFIYWKENSSRLVCNREDKWIWSENNVHEGESESLVIKQSLIHMNMYHGGGGGGGRGGAGNLTLLSPVVHAEYARAQNENVQS